MVVCAVCRVVSGCSRCKEKSLPFDERSPDAVYASLLVGPQDLDASEAEGGSAPRVYHPDVLPVPSTRCPRIGGTLEIRFSETVDRPVATAYWRKPGTGQDGTGEGDAVFEAIVSEFGQDYIYEQASTCVGYGVLPRDAPATGRETFTAIQGLPQGVYAWTSVPHELDGITTMRYALARLVLADGDRGDLVLAHTTAGEAAAPTDPEEMSVLLDAAVQCTPEPPPPRSRGCWLCVRGCDPFLRTRTRWRALRRQAQRLGHLDRPHSRCPSRGREDRGRQSEEGLHRLLRQACRGARRWTRRGRRRPVCRRVGRQRVAVLLIRSPHVVSGSDPASGSGVEGLLCRRTDLGAELNRSRRGTGPISVVGCWGCDGVVMLLLSLNTLIP